MDQNPRPTFVCVLGRDNKSYQIEVLNSKMELKIHHYFHFLLLSMEFAFQPRLLRLNRLSHFIRSASWKNSPFHEAVPLLDPSRSSTSVTFRFWPHSRECSLFLEHIVDVIKFLRNEAPQLRYDYATVFKSLSFPHLIKTMNWLLNIPEELWELVSKDQYTLSAFSDLVYVYNRNVNHLPFYLSPLIWVYFSLNPRFLIRLAAYRSKVLPVFRKRLDYLMQWSELNDSIVLDNIIGLE